LRLLLSILILGFAAIIVVPAVWIAVLAFLHWRDGRRAPRDAGQPGPAPSPEPGEPEEPV
jgi:hypothetical protein